MSGVDEYIGLPGSGKWELTEPMSDFNRKICRVLLGPGLENKKSE